jgi:hypothetical protein
LVFEVQSVATGHYIGGLIAEVMIRSASVEEQRMAALEIPGVTAYYELVHSFPLPGTYSIALQVQADGRELTATFVQSVSANPLFGDWATMLGNGVILAVCMATWIGAVLALQRRLPM